MDRIEAFAPAKINLALHVTGRRADGYHLLDSLVVFADVGDRIFTVLSETPALFVRGPQAASVPRGAENLCLRAARLMGVGAEIHLEKHLPVAAGIGGGSSDGAATLRALAEISGRPPPEDLTALGADVPVCMLARAAWMSGIGDNVRPVTELPALHGVLANPGVAVSTAQVFQQLKQPQGAKLGSPPSTWGGVAGVCAWLEKQRNDLERPAIALMPVIDEVLRDMRVLDGALLVRMSGSGATCFALFDTRIAAESAATELAQKRPQWWIRPVTFS